MASSLRVLLVGLAGAVVVAACSTTVTISVPESATPVASDGSGSSDAEPERQDGAGQDEGAGSAGSESGAGLVPDSAIWTDADCDFSEPPRVSTRCGYLEVPERWDDPADDDTLRLHVGIFSTGPKEAEPIVYLEGGPGGDPLANIAQSFETFFGVMAKDHDIVVLGQRGTGTADPHLQCDEVLDLSIELLDEPPDDARELGAFSAAYAECANRFADSGIDTSAYNSVQNAHDVDALRIALGHDAWNVLGVSYGTRLGQTLLRLHPEGVRAIVLDSVLPTERDPSVDQPVTARRSFEQLWEGCGASAVCGEAFPNLEARYFDLVDQLDVQGIELEVNNIVTGARYDAVINGDGLLDLTFSALYSRSAIAGLPEMVAQLEAGDTSGLAALASQAVTSEEYLASGMFWSVECHEEVPFISDDAIGEGLTGDPRYDRLRPPEALDLIEAICSALDAGVAPAVEDELVISDIPALVLAGSYDPITPPEGSRSVLAGLEVGTFVELPHTGHGAIADECGQQIVVAFLADPTTAPSTACTDAIAEPPWVPDLFSELTFEPFSFDATFSSASGVKPVGWDDLGDGTFVQLDNALHTSIVLQQVVPAAPTGLLLRSFEGALGVDLQEVDELDVGGRSWTRYEAAIPGSILDVVLAADDEDSYVVVLQHAPADHEAALAALLVPTLEAINA